MQVFNKIMNVFGIILAWILSIVLIIMLIVTPVVLSAVSMLDAEVITKVVTAAITQPSNSGTPSSFAKDDAIVAGNLSAQGQTGIQLNLLAGKNTQEQVSAQAEGFDVSKIDPGMLEDFLGQEVDQEALGAILSSETAKELIGAYTDDLTGVLSGTTDTSEFNAETIKEIVNDNLDEIVDILQEHVPECAEMDKEELKSKIQTAVNENAEQLVEALPKPEEIKEEIMGENPELEMVLRLVAQKEQIKLFYVGVIALLCILIFLLRLPGFRGFRWLATDLFVAGGIGVLICLGLGLGTTAVYELLSPEPALLSVVEPLLKIFSIGVMQRTTAMLVAAVVLLVIYLIIKGAYKRKAARLAAEKARDEAIQAANETAKAETLVEAEAETVEVAVANE